MAELLCSDYDDEPATCPICYSDMEWEDCWQCHGEGGFHECGDDTCCCLNKEEITDLCDECHGQGGYLVCTALPHAGIRPPMGVDLIQGGGI